MTRITRETFLQQLAEKSVDVQQAEADPALDLRTRNAVIQSDRNRDGVVADGELDDLFTRLDNLEHGEGSRDHINVGTDEAPTALGRALAAIKEIANQDASRGGTPLRRLVERHPDTLKTNQDLINHFLWAANDNWGRAQRLASSFGTNLDALVKDRGGAIDLGPEPAPAPTGEAPPVVEAPPSPVQHLDGSVGVDGDNNREDVANVQQVLEARGFLTSGTYESGVLDAANPDDPTVAAIKRFQAEYTRAPDGQVSVDGKAHVALRAPAARGHAYEVRPDDSPLGIIRDLYRDANGEPLSGIQASRLLLLVGEINPSAEGLAAGRIQTGDQIELPSTELIRERLGIDTRFSAVKPESRTYTVRGGDSLWSIARAHGVSLASLRAANAHLGGRSTIHPGQVLTLPAAGQSDGSDEPDRVDGTVPVPPTAPPTDFTAQRFKPFSAEAIALFTEAARQAGIPESWARSSGLHNILARESNGWVGIPNYSYGSRKRDKSQWAEVHAELREGRLTGRIVNDKGQRSSATGLGQLILPNVDAYYPSGRAGIGDPMEEAIGMLKYIKARYGSPGRAWSLYGVRHQGY